MTLSELAILLAGWVVWVTPFFRARRNSGRANTVDRRARWGILLVGMAYGVIWQGRFWEMRAAFWQLALSAVFLTLAGVLSWTGVHALGRHWRIDAGLDSEHQLVTSGPYRFVRHPIYTSMLCMLLGTGILISRLPLLVLSIVVFIAGTEIRVRLEEQLLARRFGDDFSAYRRRVPAYVPFLR